MSTSFLRRSAQLATVVREAAIRTLNNRDVGGRALTVNEARPKTNSGGGGFGRGGGGGGSRRSEPRW